MLVSVGHRCLSVERVIRVRRWIVQTVDLAYDITVAIEGGLQ